jgi:hypothetical protein
MDPHPLFPPSRGKIREGDSLKSVAGSECTQVPRAKSIAYRAKRGLGIMKAWNPDGWFFIPHSAFQIPNL